MTSDYLIKSDSRRLLNLVISLWLLITATTDASASEQAVRIVGPLHTNGMQINDATGKPVRFLGVNSSSFEYGSGRQYRGQGRQRFDFVSWAYPEQIATPATFDIIQSAGFNCVRLPVSWSNLEPVPPQFRQGGGIVHQWNQEYVNAVDAVVNEFGRRGIAVILSMHQWAWSPAFVDPKGKRRGFGMPAWFYHSQLKQMDGEMQFCFNRNPILPGYTQADGYIDVCRFWTKHFANNRTVVAIDMCNEFPHYQGFKLSNFYERVGAAIREKNPSILLIVQEAHSATLLRRKPHLDNIVYSIHFYPPGWDHSRNGKPTAHEHLARGLARAKEWNLPLFVGEFGRFGGKNADGYVPEMLQMMQYCKQNGVSYTYFPFQPVMGGSIVDLENEVRYPLIKVLQAGF